MKGKRFTEDGMDAFPDNHWAFARLNLPGDISQVRMTLPGWLAPLNVSRRYPLKGNADRSTSYPSRTASGMLRDRATRSGG